MQKLPKSSLVIDVSNLLYRVAAVQKHSPYARDAAPEDMVGLCMHISLSSIHKWWQKYRPEFVVFAFEGGDNWRKLYTAKHASRRAYKGNRVQDPSMQHFYELMDAFYETMKTHTSVCCLKVPGMEADDAIAAYAQLYSSPEHKVYIISGDRDFIQLTKDPNVKLVNPDNGKLRNQPGDKDYEPDIDYWLFLKCIRGDGGDNVPSAFPRVRETKIREAYTDPYKRINLMNERWKDENGVEHVVGELFEENIILLDLAKQPDETRVSLLEGVAAQVDELGKYSHFHFLRFLNDFKLRKVAEEGILARFVDLLSNNQRFLKGQLPAQTQEPQVEVEDDAPSALRPTAKSSKLLEF